MTTRIAVILADKGSEVWSLGPTRSVLDAIDMMADKHVGALAVVGDSGKLEGIISERDYARKVILVGKSSRATPVTEIMTRDVIYVTPDITVDQCMALMTARRVRHLPVLEDGDALVGMISVGDLVKSIISDQEDVIEQLEAYIRG